MGQAQIVKQTAECLFADHSLPDVLVAVELRSAGGSRVIAVPDFYAVETDGCIEMLQRLIETFFADYVVSGNMRVAGIDASADGDDSLQPLENFCDLFETAAEREFGAGCVLDPDGQ